MVRLCSDITRECTGKSFKEWRLAGHAELELRKVRKGCPRFGPRFVWPVLQP